MIMFKVREINLRQNYLQLYSLVESCGASNGSCLRLVRISSSSSMWMLLASRDQYQTPGPGLPRVSARPGAAAQIPVIVKTL